MTGEITAAPLVAMTGLELEALRGIETTGLRHAEAEVPIDSEIEGVGITVLIVPRVTITEAPLEEIDPPIATMEDTVGEQPVVAALEVRSTVAGEASFVAPLLAEAGILIEAEISMTTGPETLTIGGIEVPASVLMIVAMLEGTMICLKQ